MAFRLFDIGIGDDEASGGAAGSGEGGLVIGTVVNNVDSVLQGKVLVRLPSLGIDVWARLVAPGAGGNAGLFYVPRIDDEVLVAMAQDSPDDAFVLGGLWNSQDGPPVEDALEAPVKRVFKTGLTPETGHKVVFDDLDQSIEITSFTEQKITIDTEKIELENTAGTLTISLDNGSQTIKISGVNVEIEATASLKLKGGTVSVEATPGTMAIKAATDCAVSGAMVRIN
jgi:uncharacterized protein involved in type VI secretion and phage assembly